MPIRNLNALLPLAGLTLISSACAEKDPAVFLKIEAIGREHLADEACALRFETPDARGVERGWRSFAECLDANRRAAAAAIDAIQDER